MSSTKLDPNAVHGCSASTLVETTEMLLVWQKVPYVRLGDSFVIPDDHVQRAQECVRAAQNLIRIATRT